MNSVTQIDCLIDDLIEKNAAFACWFQSSSDSPQLIAGSAGDIIFPQSIQQLSQVRGFVFAPFKISRNVPVIVLQPAIHLKGYSQIQAFDPDTLDETPFHQETKKPCISTDFQDYLICVNHAIEQIHAARFSKVIVSRRICKEKKHESLGSLFLGMREKNPGVFVFVVNLPRAGLWMGATPELLFRSDGRHAQTVSLAATQPRRPDGQYCWFTKEIEEQAFVSRYTVDVLHRFGFSSYQTKGPQDLETATVAHLKTSFFFSGEPIEDRLGEFVEQLCPTPAVCGLPKAEAGQFINDFEPHDRRYYTGFLGPWRLEKSGTDVYVNLRSMEIEDTQYVLYTGGGITARSNPEQEWEETSQKSRTLLNAIEALQEQV
ncbi:chorismate-binding protein [uncultured Desulfobacter sp.]|uniref:chorismate-binding protein n=1 Tax=uncultured Desulfobacter sp. TaxID=240139 RepID=UPI002AAB017F|nr:chorismate-binding protein [uncultured Desulfobacter sp.]